MTAEHSALFLRIKKRQAPEDACLRKIVCSSLSLARWSRFSTLDSGTIAQCFDVSANRFVLCGLVLVSDDLFFNFIEGSRATFVAVGDLDDVIAEGCFNYVTY